MNIAQFVKTERAQKSPCCGGRVQIMYQVSNTTRTALAYVCLKCDRLHVLDSRDEEPLALKG